MTEQEIHVSQKNVSYLLVQGTLFYQKGVSSKKGVLLVHGSAVNRLSYIVLAKRLVAEGYFILSIDLPSHYLNKRDFSLGEASEEIQQAVFLLRKKYGMKTVGLIAHSIGTVAGIFALMGYSRKLESNLNTVWEELITLIDKIKPEHNSYRKKEMSKMIETLYSNIKSVTFQALKEKIKSGAKIDCAIFLAAPSNVKKAMPGLSYLNKLSKKNIKKVVDTFLHKPGLKQIEKEGNPNNFVRENNPNTVYWKDWKITEIHSFLEYMSKMKEPADFLSFMEHIIQFKKTGEKINFFEYYRKRYLLDVPKFFIYGYYDLFLRSWTPLKRHRIDKYYKSLGNAKIWHGHFSHQMNEDKLQPDAVISFQNKGMTRKILHFLKQHL